MKTLFGIVILLTFTACGQSPTAPSTPAMTVTPSGFQTWVQTDPHYTVTGGDGHYNWGLDYGDGLLVQMGPQFSQAEFRPNRPGAFAATVTDSSGHKITVTGMIQ